MPPCPKERDPQMQARQKIAVISAVAGHAQFRVRVRVALSVL